MSITLNKIIIDAKKIAGRLKDRQTFTDKLLVDTETMKNDMESMQEFQLDIHSLNKLARNESNSQIVNIINKELPNIRQIERENRELRASLEDHQRALEQIMKKYREHTQHLILNTKIDVTNYNNNEKNKLITLQAAKIQEMAAVMSKAASIDEEKINKEQEYLSKLITENKGLRELLEISKNFGTINTLGSTAPTTTTATTAATAAAKATATPTATALVNDIKKINYVDKCIQTDLSLSTLTELIDKAGTSTPTNTSITTTPPVTSSTASLPTINDSVVAKKMNNS